LLHGFLTRAPNSVVGPIHPKAMPVTRPDRLAQILVQR
jgi:putative SOS response-associated peptidase YedK